MTDIYPIGMKILIPQIYIKKIYDLNDKLKDSETNKNVNNYNLWEYIEETMPEIAEGEWVFNFKNITKPYMKKIRLSEN